MQEGVYLMYSVVLRLQPDIDKPHLLSLLIVILLCTCTWNLSFGIAQHAPHGYGSHMETFFSIYVYMHISFIMYYSEYL